jgi:hypothetical protein
MVEKDKRSAKKNEIKKLDEEERKELLNDKSEIESMLAYLEDEYRNARISEKNYREMKEKNLNKLKEIDSKLSKYAEEGGVVQLTEEKQPSEEKIETVAEKPEVGQKKADLLEMIFGVKKEVKKELPSGIQPAEVETPAQEVSAEKPIAEPAAEKKEMGLLDRLFGWGKKKVQPSVQTTPSLEAAVQEITSVEKPVVEEKVEPKEGETVGVGKEEIQKKPGLLEKLLGKKEVKEERPTEVPKVEEKPLKEPEETGKKEEGHKVGLLGKLFGRKEEKKEITEEQPEEIPIIPTSPEQAAEIAAQGMFKLEQGVPGPVVPTKAEVVTPQAEVAPVGEIPQSSISIELEKLKVMIDTTREALRATDETIRGLSESIGEIRSMVFQADAGLKENMMKLEKIEDEVSEVKPQEISKKFRETNDTLERHQIALEKLERKSEDLAEKINKVHDMLKDVGGVENLANISSDIQKRVEEIKEVVKYIERLASKTEKFFLDLSRSWEDFVTYKAKQDALDESVKDLIKAVDGLNVKFESYVSKKDWDRFVEDLVLMQKQIEEIGKVLPIAQLNLPETIQELRKERNDIHLFLESLEEQFKEKKISKGEYEEIKRNNLKKLEEIDAKLKKEWEKLEQLMKPPEKVGPVETTPVELPAEQKVEEAKPEVEGEKPVTAVVEEKVEPKKGKTKKKEPKTKEVSEAQKIEPVEPTTSEKKQEVKVEEKVEKKQKVKPEKLKEKEAKPKKKVEEESEVGRKMKILDELKKMSMG